MAEITLTLHQMIKLGIDIFDFDFPIYDENYRNIFKNLFIDYFLLEEIAHETPELFKLRLKTKLNLIMPKYNKLYESQAIEQRITDNYDVTETYTKEVEGSGSVDSSGTSKNMYKDTPKTKIDITKFDTVTNLTKVESSNEQLSNTTGTEKFTRTMKGAIGVQTDADNIVKYWASLRNVTLEIFENELSCLFMGVFN